MLELDDPWWVVALILLLGMWAVEIAIPVKITLPALRYAKQLVAQDGRDEEAELPPRPPTLSTLWPLLALILSGLLTVLALWRRFVDDERATRWNWLIIAAGLTFLAAMMLLQLTASVAKKLAG